MLKRKIDLTETQLRKTITKSIKKVLNEMGEGGITHSQLRKNLGVRNSDFKDIEELINNNNGWLLIKEIGNLNKYIVKDAKLVARDGVFVAVWAEALMVTPEKWSEALVDYFDINKIEILPANQKDIDYFNKIVGEHVSPLKRLIKNESIKLTESQFKNMLRETTRKVLKEYYDNEEEFVVNGYYTLSNAGGYEIMLSDDGEMAKVRDAWAWSGKNPQTSEWLSIEWVEMEDGEVDEEGYPETEPIIDPNGYNIPLNMVMRAN